MSQVTFVIVSYNQPAMLRRCLESILAYENMSDKEIVVVDNNSSDPGIRDISMVCRSVKFVFLERNIGFGRANNHAVYTHAKGGHLVLLNPDAYLVEPIADELTGFLNGDSRVEIVGPRILNPDGSLQYSTHGYPSIAKECLRVVPGVSLALQNQGVIRTVLCRVPGASSMNLLARYRSYSDKTEMVDEVTGACFCMKRDAFMKLGGFDPNYFMYLEEADLCFRVRSSGGLIAYHPRVCVVHELHGTSADMSSTASRNLLTQRCRSLVYFVRKNYSPRSSGVLRLCLGLVLTVRIGIEAVLSLFSGASRGLLKRDLAHLRVCLTYSGQGEASCS